MAHKSIFSHTRTSQWSCVRRTSTTYYKYSSFSFSILCLFPCFVLVAIFPFLLLLLFFSILFAIVYAHTHTHMGATVGQQKKKKGQGKRKKKSGGEEGQANRWHTLNLIPANKHDMWEEQGRREMYKNKEESRSNGRWCQYVCVCASVFDNDSVCHHPPTAPTPHHPLVMMIKMPSRGA